MLDIMAQQLKFIGCLQLMMEELSNLASGLGVDGGQLRYQLYLWLERQVDALIDVCNYDGGTVDGEDAGWWGDNEVGFVRFDGAGCSVRRMLRSERRGACIVTVENVG